MREMHKKEARRKPASLGFPLLYFARGGGCFLAGFFFPAGADPAFALARAR
jgi:hypothetical protein